MEEINIGDKIVVDGYWNGDRIGTVLKIEDGGYITRFPGRVMAVKLERDRICLYNEDLMRSSMASVSGGFENIKLGVWEDEGNIPHFHFYHGVAPNKGVPNYKKHYGGCICFLTPNYFSHGSHKERMNSIEMKYLKKFISSRYKETKMTVWQYMITLWNDNNPEVKQVPYDYKIPNYSSTMKTIQDE